MPNTDRFNELYGQVTKDLITWVDEEAQAGRLDQMQATWFLGELIPGFEAEFRAWGTAKGDVATYLWAFDRPSVHSDLRLAAHVFLHIAYDLPRVIANSIASNPSVTNWGRAAFVRPGPRFLKVFLKEMRSGKFGLVAKLSSRWDAAQMLGYWVIALRSVAWIHGEILADPSGGPRPALEQRMAQAMQEAGALALQHRWLWGVENLDNARLTSALPFGAAISAQTVGTIAAAAAAAAVLGGLWQARRQRRIIAAIDVFGAMVHQRMLRAVSPDLALGFGNEGSRFQKA